MLHLAEAIASREIEVDLVLVRAEGSNFPLVPTNIHMIDLNTRHTFFSLLPLINYLKRKTRCITFRAFYKYCSYYGGFVDWKENESRNL